jgi:hypothetical protein
MGALKLHTLKQKLWAIVAVSFVARAVVLFLSPNTPSALAPDEGTYAGLAKWVSESKPASEFPGLDGVLYLQGRSLFLPTISFIKFGMNELDAVRLTSSIYGFLGLCAVVYLICKLLKSNASRVFEDKKIERLTIVLVFIFAFLPSHFVWSNLGLRESPNEFWLIITFLCVYREGESKKLLLALSIAISIVCTFSSRPQVGWVLVASLLIYSMSNLRNKFTYLLITSVVSGLFAGYFVTTSFTSATSDVNVPIGPSTTSTNASKLAKSTNASKLANLANVAIDQVKVLPGRQIGNQAGAASSIERLACPWSESSEIGKYGCLVFRAPYMTLTFLFRPLPFIDTTSRSSTFAAAENTIWILMFGLIVYRIFRYRRIPFIRALAPSMTFLFLFVVGAGSYQGNMGTAFRHKSLILWIVLLLLFAVFWRNQEKSKELQGNNSQENAV